VELLQLSARESICLLSAAATALNTTQISADLANLKREFAMLSETVHRFRAQSLAGISENMAEKEQAIKHALSEEMHRELEVRH
jgi:hypothetical protein